jgi:hypothetical protein
MLRRTIPRAAAGTTAVLALSLGLFIGQTGSASASSSSPSASSQAAAVTTASATKSTPAAGGDVRRVSGAAQLQAALKSARPGQVIQLADGVYKGKFVATGSGTSAKPIVLRGGRGAVLDSGAYSTGMTLQLDGANYWRLEGFTIRKGQKGLVLDKSNHNVLSKLDVGNVGMEAVHFRSSSSDNRLEGSDIHDTGHFDAGRGEGVYIGTAFTSWDEYGNSGGMDRSDRNVITGNRIHAVTAENIDVKEGTVDGQITSNVLEGDRMSGVHHGDSWVDVKGNGYLVADNIGEKTLLDGFQTHVQLKGWGQNNTFRGNSLMVNGKGVGINIYKADASSGNVVACDNKVTGAAGGVTNLRCR